MREGVSAGVSNGVEPVDDSGSCSGSLIAGDKSCGVEGLVVE